MFKKPISLAVAVLGTTAFCWVAACGSSNKGTPSNTGTGTGTNTGTGTQSSGTGTGTGTGTGSGNTGTSTSTSTATGGVCTGAASSTNSVIDDMSAHTITFVPPTCAEKGAWYTFADDGASVMPAQGAAFTYSALPTGFPGTVIGSDAGSSGDGGASGPQAACVQGTTAATQYAVGGMGVQLTSVNPPSDGGASTPAEIDGSSFSGVQFWLWASSATASSVSQGLVVQFFDKQEDPSLGVCDADASTGGTACGAAGAAISGSLAASTNGSGTLNAADGGNASIASGWQLIQVPWTAFLVNPFYGEGNETVLDPTTLTKLQFQVQQTQADAGAGLSFDFCVYDVTFY